MEKQNIANRIKGYLNDVKSELKKVTWPSRDDLQKTTMAVIVLSIIFGIYLKFIDYAFRMIVDRVINIFK
ncbi:MAG: preprotein translocase subunit SecE [Candidatus Omnitrophota bacterium]